MLPCFVRTPLPSSPPSFSSSADKSYVQVIFNIFHPARYLLSERKDSPASSIEEGQEEK